MLQEVLKATKSRVLKPGIKPLFPTVISEWNSLGMNIRNSSSINVFKKELLNFIRQEPNSTCNTNGTKGLINCLQDCGLDYVI